MITEFFIWVMGQTASLMLMLFPAGPTSGSTESGLTTGLGVVLGYAAGFGSWVPWAAIGPAILVVLGVLLAASVIRLVRIVASFLTLGGGSAA